MPMMGVVEIAASRSGKYDRHLAVENPDRVAEAIGPKLYQATVMILRESGRYWAGRKINSRRAADEECGSTTGNENEEWETIHISD